MLLTSKPKKLSKSLLPKSYISYKIKITPRHRAGKAMDCNLFIFSEKTEKFP